MPDIQQVAFAAIARDPETIFAYWDPDGLGDDKLTGKPGANVRAVTSWVLRVVCQSDLAVFDFEIDPAAGNYYVRGLKANKEYELRLSLKDTMGDVHSLAKVPCIITPRSNISNKSAAGWEIDGETLVRMMGHSGGEFLGSSNNK